MAGPAPRLSPGIALGPAIMLAAAATTWLLSLGQVDLGAMTDLGLLSVLPGGFYLALAILTFSFAALFRRPRMHRTTALLHVVVLILMIHGTPVLLYNSLRYSWAWKHVGMVDYIQRHEYIDPYVGSLAAYHNWPGFFALATFWTESAGLPNALPIAEWAPVFFNLINLAALALVYRAVTRHDRFRWLAIWLYFATNWVGQDYFAPQALAFFLYLIVIGICLNWFKPLQPLHVAPRHSHPWLVDSVTTLFRRAAATEPPAAPSSVRQRLFLFAIVVLCLGGIAGTHQLTPFNTVGALTLLVIFQRCRARMLPLLMVVFTMAWFAYPALPFFANSVQDLGSSLGAVSDNALANLHDMSRASPGQVLVSSMGRGLTASVWVLAFIGFLVRVVRGRFDLSTALLAGVPFTLVVLHSYEGEMLFRVYLYSLPFMMFFCAMLLRRLFRGGLPRVIGVALVSGLFLTGSLFAYYGKDNHYYFSPDEVAAAMYLVHNAPKNSLVIEGTSSYPSKFRNYEYFTHVTIVDEPYENQKKIMNEPVRVLSSWLDNARFAASYIIVTRSQKVEADELGDLPLGALERIERALRHSHRFKTIYVNKDAAIIVLSDTEERNDGEDDKGASLTQ